MSFEPTHITAEIAQYLYEEFSVEDDFLRNLRNEAIEAGIPDIAISPDQGAFLQFLLYSINAKYVMEIGSLAGYSAITMARALPDDGKLICLEIDPTHATFIARKAEEAGLAHIIEVYNSDAREFLLNYRPPFLFDFVFIDAEKRDYLNYFKICTALLRKGGIIAADNALAFGEIIKISPGRDVEDIKGIRDFNDFISRHREFRSCLATIGDGTALALKI